ncbi:UNVERIFIED_CONTAM: hypothetical protein PYX00_010881 [Menopon gallinae]|uniref:acetate--CoA ligase n=1 Tax=Menopon gallinae TaxID=328185 RepID=A0AAW2H6M8_9NEOP
MLTWEVPFTKAHNGLLFGARWFEDGKLNACYNAVDRHAQKNPEKVGMIYSGNDGEVMVFTYKQILGRVCEVAAVLRSLGLEKGDCATIYLPMSPEACFSALACARLGVIHNVVFGGYSSESLAKRVRDSESKVLITCETARRDTKSINFFGNASAAVRLLEGKSLQRILVFNSTSENLEADVDVHYFCREIQRDVFVECVSVEAEHPLFYLYTSGSTGKPKGIVHATAGYLLYAAMTLRTCFDFRESDVMGCTADLGWITGHTYSMYAPLLLNGTTVIFGGSPLFPTEFRLFEMIDRHRVTHLYTAPTAIRVLKKVFVQKGLGQDLISSNFDMTSLRFLGSVGEPINREAYEWFSAAFGKGESAHNRHVLPDRNWRVYVHAHTWAFIATKDSDENNIVEAKQGELGVLLIQGAWPGMARGIINDQERYRKSYFDKYPGFYFTGDEAFVDEKGYLWVRGRVDDVLNVSGHRFSTAEIESAVCSDASVDEAAVVGVCDSTTGQAIHIFVVCRANVPSKEIDTSIRATLRKKIGPIANPKNIIVCKSIPKTRTGKIMRRVLRGILMKETLGDVSTCANLDSIESLRALAR